MSRTAVIRTQCPRCRRTYAIASGDCPEDGAALVAIDTPGLDASGTDDDVRVGTVVADDFELRHVVGVGAMGRVYRAHQRSIDRDVAVKILHRELSANPDIVRRFHREAKIASRLKHPHVVEVHGVGQLPDGALYIIMEFLDGVALSELLAKERDGLAEARSLRIMLQIADAVGEAHAQGVVHRDLKPENVMLVRRGAIEDWVKILDFGIAKAALHEGSHQTAAGLVFGTARYISPEGAEGRDVGPAGDVYALATMLYQMLVGHTPFEGDVTLGLLVRRVHEDAPPLAACPRGAAVSSAVSEVIMTNLARDPSRRASDGHAFAADLAGAAEKAGIDLDPGGVLARRSRVNVIARVALAPTLDDAAAQPAVAPSAPPPAPATSPAKIDDKSRPRMVIALITLAFLLGVAVTALVADRLSAHGDERAAYVGRVRRALSEQHYTTPPGDNVRDLVEAGMRRWPDDEELVHLRGEAAHDLLTRAMAARASGDGARARALASEARLLEPANETIKSLEAEDRAPDAKAPATRAR